MSGDDVVLVAIDIGLARTLNVEFQCSLQFSETASIHLMPHGRPTPAFAAGLERSGKPVRQHAIVRA